MTDDLDQALARAEAAEALLADVERLCTIPVDGEQRSHVPVREVLAIVRGEAGR